MTEADIQCLHEIWPEGRRDHGLMLHQAPDPVLDALRRHPWDSVALRGMIETEHRERTTLR